jgi:hypothetical protein
MPAQLLKVFDRIPFAKIVRKYNANKGTKGFTCWDFFVCLIFAQVSGANSLRDIVGGLADKE